MKSPLDWESPAGGPIEKAEPIYLQVYRRLRHAIVTERIRPGERLVESRLAADLDVSRAPVREALRKLEQDGLVTRADGGLEVTRLSLRQVRELYACRSALERLAAYEAALAVREGRAEALEALERAREALERHREALADPVGLREALVEATNAFHDAVCAASGNATLAQLMSGLQDRIVFARHASLAIPGNAAAYLEHHRDVLEAVRAGEPERAAAVMEEHIREAGERVARHLRQEEPEPRSPG
ncbi:MAG: GntR family transcriptional regulator [Firmicutes bacterium]|nr:GntR family transcriptional regulator [Bacillota bacterium]